MTQIDKLSKWATRSKKPLIIAGPCSAETEEQLLDTCRQVKQQGVKIMRAGVWKPRTRPNTFEGVGTEALEWIQHVKKELDVKFAIEVANPHHVELALKHDIDILWIGARSTVNPFTVQEIADAMTGLDIPVMIKNPVNPDLALWMGAIERVANAGITKMAAIHRGFSSHQESKFRNIPMWQLPIELRTRIPEMPIICDPSHIAGNRSLIAEISQKALDLVFDGLMIETHRDPENAWSDAKQQVTPEVLGELVANLVVRHEQSEDMEFLTRIEHLRDQIDQADREIIDAFSNRMQLVDKIADLKQKSEVTVLQVDRWKEIYESRAAWAEAKNLGGDFIHEIYKLIHDAAIRRQEEIMNARKADA